MTEVSLAWLLTKVTSPVVGATKLHHIEGAAKAVDLTLTPEEILYLETCMVHRRPEDRKVRRKRQMAEKIVQTAGRNQLGGV